LLEGLGSVSKIPELQRRILFTILLLAVYRIGVYIPTPGIDILSRQKVPCLA
jgi:preprotein translocase subunit SecY